MNLTPMKYNTVSITTLAIIASTGIVVRLTIHLPVIPGLVELTPGFLFSELGGIVGGIPGGALVGFIVGLGGALGGGEDPLLPMVGNIALGIGTGFVIHLIRDRNSMKYAILTICGGGLIGGLLPSLVYFISIGTTTGLALFFALIDMYQALGWAAAALLLESFIIRPIIGNYLYPSEDELVLDTKEIEEI